MKTSSENWKYAVSLGIPAALLFFSIFILANHYISTGDWFERSIELKGGMLITINTPTPPDIKRIETVLGEEGNVLIRELRSLSGHTILIETEHNKNATQIIERIKTIGIDVSDFSIETIGPSLGESFWRQAQISISIAFIFMGLIVFFIFRTFVPSFAVMLAAVSDIIGTLAFMQIFGIPMSLASFAAILMLIGYSIDTDILLTTRVLKEEMKIDDRVKSAFKTGITMTGTTLAALIAVITLSSSRILIQIASVLIIGLIIDLINTWLQNATIIKLYVKRRS